MNAATRIAQTPYFWNRPSALLMCLCGNNLFRIGRPTCRPNQCPTNAPDTDATVTNAAIHKASLGRIAAIAINIGSGGTGQTIDSPNAFNTKMPIAHGLSANSSIQMVMSWSQSNHYPLVENDGGCGAFVDWLITLGTHALFVRYIRMFDCRQ